MNIEDHKVVGIEYTLKNSAGEVIDSNAKEDLLHFIQGAGNIVPGLERAMAGRSEGESFEVRVLAVDGYGEYDEELIRRIPRARIKNLGKVKEGMTLQMRGPNGLEDLTVTAVNDQEIVADGNHPLAGQDLHFTIRVAEIREPTAEELEHGHVHSHGGHHHH